MQHKHLAPMSILLILITYCVSLKITRILSQININKSYNKFIKFNDEINNSFIAYDIEKTKNFKH